MPDLSTLLRRGRRLRVIGFDDAPFVRRPRGHVCVSGIVTAGTRFEGMLWTRVVQDGWNATDVLARTLRGSKFLPQLHAVLLDGIAFGGFNVVDLVALHHAIALPCLAVMRRPPDMAAITRAVGNLPRPERRLATMRRAGPVHEAAPFCFQACGATPADAAELLRRVTDTGHVPEALRLAHLIGSAVQTGESGKRA